MIIQHFFRTGLRCVLPLAVLAGSCGAAPAVLSGPEGGGVLVEICEEGLSDRDQWPAQPPVASESFTAPAFALDQLPPKYVADGVRGVRPSPSLLRFSATVEMPPGRHRILVRARSAARLLIDGKLVTETKFPPKNGGDGSQHDTERMAPLDLGAGFRFAPGGEREVIAEFTTPGGRLPVVLEAFAGGREGGKPRRVEPGETVVAASWENQPGWVILTDSGAEIPYTDSAWKRYREKLAVQLAERNAATRARLRSAQDGFWEKRRAAATTWLTNSPEVPVPASTADAATHPVDAFLAARLREVQAQNHHAQPGAVDYFREIRPVLESRCVDCHRGPKAKGGLRLDSRAAALEGGDSGPALVPGAVERSEILKRIQSRDEDEVMPPQGARLTSEEAARLTRWVQEGVSWPELPLERETLTPPADDYTFLRRVTLDTIGLVPEPEELRAFAADPSPDKRTRAVDRLLADPRQADHWMGMWQDLLAENPNILNPTLNNTGPFRWWLHEALQDDLPLDRMVTQLIGQDGDANTGGPAGFGLASQNDVPFAAKGTIVSAAFLGLEMKCARCHDSPAGTTRQEQLFQLGALLAETPLDVPVTSSVDPVKLKAGGRKALIEVTLPPGSKVQPVWPFPKLVDPALADSLALHPNQPRERLAALLTAPQNTRFAQVVVNRLWQRLMGRGLVEPVDDWDKGQPTHPELLEWLGREFVRNGYQVRPLLRLILTSAAWQRAADPALRQPDPLYTAPAPRRLSAEQVVDSLFAATGKPMPDEPVSLDLNGQRETNNSQDLGRPQRAWMLASLSNERDRPSLALPRLQALLDVMEALGWRGARQDPVSVRDTAPNALQPAVLANGVMTGWLTRLSADHGFTALALTEQPVEQLVEVLFLRLLSRPPGPEELARHTAWLKPGYATRCLPASTPALPVLHRAPKLVTWTNHLLPESNTAKREEEAAARRGDPPTPLLDPAWRDRCEDVIWSLINSPETIYRP